MHKSSDCKIERHVLCKVDDFFLILNDSDRFFINANIFLPSSNSSSCTTIATITEKPPSSLIHIPSHSTTPHNFTTQPPAKISSTTPQTALQPPPSRIPSLHITTRGGCIIKPKWDSDFIYEILEESISLTIDELMFANTLSDCPFKQATTGIKKYQ